MCPDLHFRNKGSLGLGAESRRLGESMEQAAVNGQTGRGCSHGARGWHTVGVQEDFLRNVTDYHRCWSLFSCAQGTPLLGPDLLVRAVCQPTEVPA